MLAPVKRTVNATLRRVGLEAEKQFHQYHPVWSPAWIVPLQRRPKPGVRSTQKMGVVWRLPPWATGGKKAYPGRRDVPVSGASTSCPASVSFATGPLQGLPQGKRQERESAMGNRQSCIYLLFSYFSGKGCIRGYTRSARGGLAGVSLGKCTAEFTTGTGKTIGCRF